MRSLNLLLATALLIFVATSCGDDTDDSTTIATDPSGAAATASSTPATSEPSDDPADDTTTQPPADDEGVGSTVNDPPEGVTDPTTLAGNTYANDLGAPAPIVRCENITFDTDQNLYDLKLDGQSILQVGVTTADNTFTAVNLQIDGAQGIEADTFKAELFDGAAEGWATFAQASGAGIGAVAFAFDASGCPNVPGGSDNEMPSADPS